ncbi:hypothetical protein J1614_003879 [Plenodomus biglobosus]|nr:hypothetical protein J1614_003879 [Plenodomus biglobosus]
MAGHRSKATQLDSFSDLAGLMKAKKPYTPIPPTAESQLVFAHKGELLGIPCTSYETAVRRLLSSWATPVPAPESVAEFIEREDNESALRAPKPSGYSEAKAQHLEALFKQMKKYDINDNETEHHPRMPSPQYQAPLLIPELGSPIHFGPRDLPTPADSYCLTPSPFLTESEPVVRLAKHVYESLSRDLDSLEKEKVELQKKVLTLERQLGNSRDEDDGVGKQLGLLEYQNAVNRTQKADMCRALNEKEVQIKTQQLEIDGLQARLGDVEADLKAIGGIAGECDYLRNILSSVHDEHTRALDEMRACKDQELEQVSNTLQQLQDTLTQVTRERDAASRAQLNVSDHTTREEKLVEMISTREKTNLNLRERYVKEQLRVTHLEDEIETLKARLNQENIDDLKQKLREKTSICDRQRGQIKIVEQHLKASEARIMKVANNGEALRGAAHLVVPHANAKLPRNVLLGS